MVKKKISRFYYQALATFLSNPILPNFFTGKIYKGKTKALCVPGLNCYSCPAAIGSCPIGSIQSVIGSSKFRFTYYIFGMLILFAVLLGRFICGFLCPFGWFQELIHKLPSPKFSTKKFHIFTYMKYGVFLVFVILLPATFVNEVGMGPPFFCKYLCPAGILEGAIPLSIVNPSIRNSLGWLFTWKFTLLLGFTTLSLFFYRPFCKWLCPLGAIYGFFNPYALYTYQVNSHQCTSCGICEKTCKMDVKIFQTPNHRECIRCGDCISACPHQAITCGFKLKKQGDFYNEKSINT